MSTKKPRRRGVATLDVVLCSIRRGQLHVLLMKSAGGALVLPYAWSTTGAPPANGAHALASDVLGVPVSWLVPGIPMAEGRHPAGAALSLPFVGTVGPAIEAGDGAAWYALDALPSLAPRQLAMAETALDTLRLHMDASPVAFRLLPPSFTLSELQQAYELLLGRRLHKASFRRTLQAAYLVVPTDAWRHEGRGRPAQLFQYAPRKRRRGHRSIRFDLLGR